MPVNPVMPPTGGIKAADPAARPAARVEDPKLRAACTEMESVFLNMLLTQMRKTVPKTGLIGGGQQEEVMQSLLDAELTKNMARAGGAGLADMLYNQLAPRPNTTNKGQAPG